jgi:HAD superfamily hydrolase (TIGR01450 family)
MTAYDVALLDLDGVVYLGRQPIPGVADALSAARSAGMHLAFVTNNASRTPDQVAKLLADLGVEADPGEVVTSAQAGARMLAERLPAGAKVLVTGADALRREVTSRGLRVVEDSSDEPDAVVQGFSPDIGWRDLAEACVAIRQGAFYVATNRDETVPSPRGPLPGNGSLVGLVAKVTGVEPTVAGKPHPALHLESVERTGAVTPLIVGDRLDTDIEGANRAGCASLLVFTGVTDAAQLMAAPPHLRPHYIARDVGGLLVNHPAPRRQGDRWECGGWTVAVASGTASLSGAGESLDAIRALANAAWADGIERTTASGDEPARALSEWNLA